MLLQLTDVNKIYNGAPLLKHISLTIEDRDRIGLIGVNGCGKSTLLKLITERILPDHIQEGDGEIIKSSHTSIGYLEQMGGLEKEQTVWHEMHNVFPLIGFCTEAHAVQHHFDFHINLIAVIAFKISLQTVIFFCRCFGIVRQFLFQLSHACLCIQQRLKNITVCRLILKAMTAIRLM